MLSFFPVDTPVVQAPPPSKFLLSLLTHDPTIYEALCLPTGRIPLKHLAGWESSDMSLLIPNCPSTPSSFHCLGLTCQSDQGDQNNLFLSSLTFLLVQDLSREGNLGGFRHPRAMFPQGVCGQVWRGPGGPTWNMVGAGRARDYVPWLRPRGFLLKLSSHFHHEAQASASQLSWVSSS